MGLLQNILNTVKRHTLDRTNLDERLVSGLSAVANRSRNFFTQRLPQTFFQAKPLETKDPVWEILNFPRVYKTAERSLASQQITSPKQFAAKVVSGLSDDPLLKTSKTYLKNWYIDPITKLPSSIKKTISPKSTLKERGKGALGILSGTAALIPDPVFDVGIPLFQLYKGAKRYQKENKEKKLKPFEAVVKGGIPAMTLEKPVGLGDVFGTTPTEQTLGNLAELPLTILAARGIKSKSMDELVKNTAKAVKEGKITMEEGQAIIGSLKEKTGVKTKPVFDKQPEELATKISDIIGRETEAGIKRRLADLKGVKSEVKPISTKGLADEITQPRGAPDWVKERVKKILGSSYKSRLKPKDVATEIKQPSDMSADMSDLTKKSAERILKKGDPYDVVEDPFVNNLINEFRIKGKKSFDPEEIPNIEHVIKNFDKKRLNEIYKEVGGPSNQKGWIKALWGKVKAEYKPKEIPVWKTEEMEANRTLVEGELPPYIRKETGIPTKQVLPEEKMLPVKEMVTPIKTGEVVEGVKKPKTLDELFSKTKTKKIKDDHSYYGDYGIRKDLGEKEAKRVIEATKSNRTLVREMLEANVNQKNANRTMATKLVEPLAKIKKEEGDAFMKAVEDTEKQKSLPQYKKLFEYVNELTNQAYEKARKAGIQMRKIKNYFPHKWKLELAEEFRIGQRTLSKNFAYAKQRVIESIEKGEELGYQYFFDTPAEALEHYVRYLNNTITNLNTLRSLERSGLLIPEALGKFQKGLERINVFGLPESRWVSPSGKEYVGGWYAEENLARILNKLWGPDTHSKTVEKIARVFAAGQDYGLSAGFPSTPLNFFTFTQTIFKDFPTAIFNPSHLKTTFKSYLHSFSNQAANKVFSEKTPVIVEMQKRGVNLDSVYTAKNLTENSFASRFISSSRDIPTFVKETWKKLMNEATFGRYMSLKKVYMFEDLSNQMIKKGVLKEQAYNIAAEAVRLWFGEKTTFQRALSNKNIQNAATILFLAPRYRESIINTVINAFQSLHPDNIKNPAYKPVRDFLIGSIILEAGGEVLNYALNNKFSWDNEPSLRGKIKIPIGKMLGWEGKKADMVIGFPLPRVSSLTALPRSAIKTTKHLLSGETLKAYDEMVGNVSYLAQPLARVFANRKFTGQPIVGQQDPNKLEKQTEFLYHSYKHPLLKMVQNVLSPEQDEIAKAKGIAEGLEMPFRVYDQRKLTNSYYFEALEKQMKGMTKEEVDDWNALKRTSTGKEIGDYPNVFADQMIKANIYLRRPSFLEKERKVAEYVSEKTGQPINPLLLLTPQQQAVVMRLKTFLPGVGSEEKSKLIEENREWLQQYWAEQTEYGEKMRKLGIFTDKDEGSIELLNINPSPIIKKKLDFYYSLPKGTGARSVFLRDNPDVVEYFELNAYLTDIKRLMLGLPEKERFGSGGYGRYGGRTRPDWNRYYEMKRLSNLISSLTKPTKRKRAFSKLKGFGKEDYKSKIKLEDIFKKRKSEIEKGPPVKKRSTKPTIK